MKTLISGRYIAVIVNIVYDRIFVSDQGNLFGFRIGSDEPRQISCDCDLRHHDILGELDEIKNGLPIKTYEFFEGSYNNKTEKLIILTHE